MSAQQIKIMETLEKNIYVYIILYFKIKEQLK